MARGRAAALIGLLWLAGVVAGAQFAKVALVLPEMGALYPQAGATLGFAVSAISVVGAVMGLTMGLIAPRIGPRRLLLGALALAAATSLAQALLPAWPLFLALRALEGAAHLGIVVAAPTLIARVAPPAWQGPAMTLWGTFFGAAFVITAALGLPLVNVQGVAALFLAHGAASLALAAVLAAAPGLAASARAPAPALTVRAVLARHASAYASPFIVAPAAGWLFFTLTFTALVTLLPTLVAGEARAVTAAAMPLASLIVTFATGALVRSFHPVRVVMLGFAGALLVGAAVWLAGVSVGLAVALAGILGLVQGASFAAIPRLNPAEGDQALAHGAMAQAGNLGNLLGTPILLLALTAFGPGGLMAGVMACHLAGLVAHAALARRRRA